MNIENRGQTEHPERYGWAPSTDMRVSQGTYVCNEDGELVFDLLLHDAHHALLEAQAAQIAALELLITNQQLPLPPIAAEEPSSTKSNLPSKSGRSTVKLTEPVVEE